MKRLICRFRGHRYGKWYSVQELLINTDLAFARSEFMAICQCCNHCLYREFS